MEFNEATLRPIIGLCGMIFLGFAFNSKLIISKYSAPIGWLLVGAYFGLSCPYYIEINDPILVLMTGFAPIAGVGLAYYEIKKTFNIGNLGKLTGVPEHLIWLRGMIFLAGTPYLLVAQIPYLNRLAILFVAWQVVFFMRWTGSGDITLGEFVINTSEVPGNQVLWDDWTGNKWWLLEQLPENGMFVQLISTDGSSIGINFVLACTALQSIIVFVGAILAVKSKVNLKVRTLMIVVPLIHILNLFRNAGLIWLHTNYPEWEWFGISIFDFGHSYASKVLSLFAMFLMAIVIFEILPKLHTNVLKVIDPFFKILNAKK
ncbi:MAG: archaeosortase A [Euryarchaeota archaeon]|nr:archaeosortase A [Euryarchaeota archaeon]